MELLDFILDPASSLAELFARWHYLSYFFLALILFMETGVVAAPFLPGDSLLFMLGAFASATRQIELSLLIPLLFLAVFLGDHTNYWLGRKVGRKLFEIKGLKRLFKKHYLERACSFYEKHGGKTVVLARFVPIIRTFAPFVAGIGRMHYPKFLLFSLAGSLFWLSSLTSLGYYFGNLSFVQESLSLWMLGIIFISLAPLLLSFLKNRKEILLERE